jgi:hypothetical protein
VEGNCVICGREETLTRHHLIPRTRHSNKKNKRDFEREVVRQVVGICRPCHSQIHALLSEKELEREYNTVRATQGAPWSRKIRQLDREQAARFQGADEPHERARLAPNTRGCRQGFAIGVLFNSLISAGAG